MPDVAIMNEKDDSLRPSGEGMITNIIKFSHLLRENGVPVSVASVLDAVRSLAFVDISNLGFFRSLLRMHFVFRKEDILLFDALFDGFWFTREQVNMPAHCSDDVGSERPGGKSLAQETMVAELPNQEDTLQERFQAWTARYSPAAANKEGSPDDFAKSDEFYRLIKKWLKPLSSHLSRRTRYAVRGKQIDLRRILRKNMQFGGELVLLDFKQKKLKNKRILFFCDVSGSMDLFLLMLLQFIHALKRIDHQTEIFFFSTDLSRWTGQFEVGNPMEAISRIPQFVSDWGGGTRIGHSLRQFNESYGPRMLSGKTIAIVFSDGWDKGEPGLLESQMAYLHSKAHRVIWLNPLMGTQDYQPICQGMSAALPYVDYFLPMGNLKDLHYLGKTLSKMVM